MALTIPRAKGGIRMILVVGATGTNGRAVLDRLAERGHEVRALVRDPSKVSADRVEVVRGDLDDPSTLAEALAGVDHAFYSAAVDRRAVEWFRNFLAAAAQAGTSHIVRLSAIGADPGSPVELVRMHGEVDRDLKASGIGYTILAPNAFYQNLLWSAKSIREEGAIYQAMGDARQSMIDVRDIAAVAVAALVDPGHMGKTYEITGPAALSFAEVAATLSDALGKSVRYVAIPNEAANAGMIASGMPEWQARAVAELTEWFTTGATSRTTDTVREITGRPPIPLEQFAREHADAFR